MFIGEYTHTLDDKKRLSLPSKFRKEIGKKVIVTHGLDQCLFVFPAPTWETFGAKLTELSMGDRDIRGFVRFMLAGAVEIEVDSIGRILIPDFLKTFAGLGSKIVLTGVDNRIEVWDEAMWLTYKRKIEQEADMLAQKLGELGVI
jgi:MraZ protein